MPWWAALLIAVSATAVGFAIDAGSGHKDLTHVFAGFYIAGCVVAVLAVRQDGVFTAVIQPPLIVFCAVPGAYWMFHGRKVGHLKDLLINCGYPLIERFPLMLGTAGGVLLIGLVRWYFGASNRTTVATAKGSSDTTTDAEDGSFASGIVAKLRSLLSRDPGDEGADGASEVDAKRERVARRAEKARQTARARSTTRAARNHSRHGRPSLDDVPESETERPRRPSRKSPGAPRDFDPAEPPRRSRRPRPQADPERGQPRGEPRTRRSPYERPTPRSSRFEGYDRYDPPVPPEQFNRYERYEPYESYEPPRRRAAPRGTNGADPTHHPISQVRYRGAPPRDEPRAERPSRSRTPGRSRGRPPAESWEYDA